MPSYTPLATPVVPAPTRSQEDSEREVRPRPELIAPVTVITPLGDMELGTGSLLIGRLPECDVLLQDNLVSRIHARISVQDECVVIEDLHSTNGVYVNGLRVGHSVVLREGDRILIGTSEISLFENREGSLQRLRAARRVSPMPAERVTPIVNPRQRLRAEPAPAPTPAPQTPSGARAPRALPLPAAAARPAQRGEHVPSTARADALKMIGGLADRLAATGNLEEAAQVLSGHLRRILKGANSGLPVPPDVAASASHHALTLARWTKLALWADYVIELHLSARLIMSAVTLAQLEDVMSRLDIDRMLLGYYVEGLRDRADQFAPDERRRFERLQFLAKEQA